MTLGFSRIFLWFFWHFYVFFQNIYDILQEKEGTTNQGICILFLIIQTPTGEKPLFQDPGIPGDKMEASKEITWHYDDIIKDSGCLLMTMSSPVQRDGFWKICHLPSLILADIFLISIKNLSRLLIWWHHTVLGNSSEESLPPFLINFLSCLHVDSVSWLTNYLYYQIVYEMYKRLRQMEERSSFCLSNLLLTPEPTHSPAHLLHKTESTK